MIEFLASPVMKSLFIVIASLAIILKAADLLILGITNYARKLGLSDAIVGLLVIATAASAPEIVSSLTGFLKGDAEIGFGAILGSNMVHAGLALGLVALVGKKVEVEPNIFTRRRFFMWISLMLPFLLALDGELSRPDGAILVLFFMAYVGYVWQIEGTLGKIKKNIKLKNIWQDSLIFLGCLAAIILSGRWLVSGSTIIAEELNVPTYFIALTVIGVGTTLPDLAIEMKSVLKKRASLGLGDLLGSLTIELVLFFGIIALIRPFKVDVNEVLLGMIFLATAITAIMIFLRQKALNWKHGAFLLGLFILFMTIETIKIA